MDRWTRWYKSTRYTPSSSFYSLQSVHSSFSLFPPHSRSSLSCFLSYIHQCARADILIRTHRQTRRHVHGPATIPNQKAGVTLASPPLTPRTGVSGCDRHRRGIEMRGSKRGKHPAQWRAAREEWEHRPTVAQGGGYVLVTLRLDAPSTSPETTSTQRAPSQSRGKRSAFSAPRVRKLPNAESERFILVTLDVVAVGWIKPPRGFSKCAGFTIYSMSDEEAKRFYLSNFLSKMIVDSRNEVWFPRVFRLLGWKDYVSFLQWNTTTGKVTIFLSPSLQNTLTLTNSLIVERNIYRFIDMIGLILLFLSWFMIHRGANSAYTRLSGITVRKSRKVRRDLRAVYP